MSFFWGKLSKTDVINILERVIKFVRQVRVIDFLKITVLYCCYRLSP